MFFSLYREMTPFFLVVCQVEDMEKKLDFLVDMHIQHSEQLAVDSAGSAHMTLEEPGAGGEIRRVFFNYAEPFPHLSYQGPVAKGNPYCGGVAGPGGAGPPDLRLPAPAIPTYTERPTVLPISSLQEGAGPGGRGRTTGGRGGDSPLSMLSVNHEELERSPSGFSISGEREGEEGGGAAPPGTGPPPARPCYLAEGETDTDTDPFTPSGGALPLSCTGEGLGDAVWSTPP